MPIIAKMTLVANNIPAMVTYYNAVLDAGFEPIPGAPDGFHRGQIAGIETLLCPNHIAQVEAKQNRQQFDFIVDDITLTMHTALDTGAQIIEAIREQDGIQTASVYDPDGNSMVFIQKVTSSEEAI
ncbi:hypothetical protein G4Y79_10835 [Phototrophicus methaneseepsis]|uniref:Glyoxalase-like domain-containing protein n=1 Tax=Phototrophicus methaneseepsis TaxID=2710758 RepID=A0A7S8IGM0_9CHLR|nr:VOC family protein [Phototrophicus methaneseepsis]QPC84837.1 hypothetical protein G4Y79_10835 [Phototrophicus methaneseepsis]